MRETQPKRVLAAVRLSRDSDESTSVEGQRDTIARWARASGYTVTLVAVDTDVSGATPSLDRPDLARNLADLGAFDIVAGIKIDRVSRDTLDFLSFARWLNSHGKWLVSTGENVCLKGDGDAASEFQATILAGAATMERQRIAERCRDSRARLARAGRWAGGTPPFGYDIRDTGQGKVLVQDPVTARYAREMAQRAIDGHSNGSIARWLNASYVPTQRGSWWKPATVGTVLRGHSLPGYAARYPRTTVNGKRVRATGAVAQRVRTDDGEDVMVTDEPILTDETWRQVQAALDSRGQQRATRTVAGHTLLRVAYCGTCSTRPPKGAIIDGRMVITGGPEKLVPMYGHRGQGRNKTRDLYRCHECSRRIRREVLEGQVEQALLDSIGDRALPRRVVIPAISHTRELAELDAKIADLDEQFQQGTVPARSYGRMMTALEKRRDELSALPQRESQVVYEPTSQTMREHWDSLDTTERGAFLRSWGVRIFSNITIRNRKDGSEHSGYMVQMGWERPGHDGERMAEAFGLGAGKAA
jgi:site-specific DNA recombinase